MHHGHKKKHHDPEQQAGPAHLNFCGNAQGSGQQRKAHEIRPKQSPRHVLGHAEHDESCAREVLRAEDRQGDGETQIAQGYDLVQAGGTGDIGLRSPQRNKEKQDAGAAHRNHRARDLKKCGENGWVHVDAWRQLACSICARSGPESPFWFKNGQKYTPTPTASLGIKARPPTEFLTASEFASATSTPSLPASSALLRAETAPGGLPFAILFCAKSALRARNNLRIARYRAEGIQCR